MAAAIPFFYKKWETRKIDYKTFHTSLGWGYDIWVDKNLFIHQENIPVFRGKKGFFTKEEAEKTARVVIDKLRNNKLPTLTNSELAQICGQQSLKGR